MGAGYFNRLVTFKRRDETSDASGASRYEFVQVDPVLVRFPCGFRPERGWERDEQGANESAVMGVLRVRSCEATRNVKASDIATLHSGDNDDRDEDFVIKYVDNRDRRDRFLHFTVETGTSVR